ncbi:MAG TPA: hypothetical protein VMZ01_06595 [Aestuariivirga sp.]|nr:hypothetical protein [Aestuariivirga sp.]
MRICFALLLSVGALWPVAAGAYENFIPLGHNYSPDDSVLPPLNSRQDQVNAQVDIFESDVYTRARTAKEFRSRLDEFSNNQELKGASTFIDY